MKKILVVGFLFLGACSHFNAVKINKEQPKEFQIQKLWVRSSLNKDNLEYRKINRSTAIIIDDILIQANSLNGIIAFNKNTGKKIWSLEIDNGVEPSFARIRDRVFVSANDGKFYSIDARVGKIIWSFDTKSENVGTPYLDEESVYFISGASVLYSLDAATGKQNWTYSHQDTSNFSIRGTSEPVVYKGMLFAGFADGTMLAFDAKIGAIKWQTQLNKNKRFRDIDAHPIVVDNQLFVPGFDDKLYCLSYLTGEVLWTIDQGGYSGITMKYDMLLYPTSSGEVLALDKSNGSVIWSYKLSAGLATQIQTLNGLAIFGESQGAVVFIDIKSGKVKAKYNPGRGVLASPLVEENLSRVYFISGEANVYALEASWISNNQWP